MKTGRVLVLVLAAALLTGACGSRGPLVYQMDAEQLWAYGQENHERGRWDQATEALDRLIMAYPAFPRLQEARFLLADAYARKGEYQTAAAEFTRLAADHPRGPYAADARFRACESYYELSPRVQLDQTHTKAAIDHCEALLQHFPNSEHAPQVREMLVEMRDKVAEKIYIGGQFYQRRRAYDSAIIYYEEVVARHPATRIAPKALLRLVESYQAIGWEDEAEAARQRLLREYPESAEAAEAQAMSLAAGS